MKLLVLNAGSSSLKYQLFDGSGDAPICRGVVDRIGSEECLLIHRPRTGVDSAPRECHASDHGAALQAVVDRLSTMPGGAPALAAIGHRVVHGGEHFRHAAVVDEPLEATLEGLAPLAPLHNPASLSVIRQCRRHFPATPQVAVFDTAFHRTLPERAWRYAVPDVHYRDHGVRRYGFHGVSHGSVARRAAAYLGRDNLRLVSLHLGSGASAAAIDGGACIDTSMGLTPLEGLVMGTRGGDMDPGVILHLARSGLDLTDLEDLLTTGSGLKGLCGSADMREVLADAAGGEHRARLALEVYTYRIRKYIGAYAVALGGLDALVFTAGVGENVPEVRARICEDLGFLGIHLDPSRNTGVSADAVSAIHTEGSGAAILVIPANEELEIARQVRELIDPGRGNAR